MFTDLIQHSSDGQFWMWALAIVALAAAGFVAAFVFFYRARIIEDTPTSKVRSAAQGYVELEGVAKRFGEQVLQAPLSNRPCVWFAYEIEKYVGGKNNKWRTVEKGTSEEFFLLEDDTGKCVINPKGAKVTPSYHAVWVGRPRQPAPATAPMASTGRLGIHVYTTGSYRYTEQRLDEGDDLYALGTFKTVHDASRLPSHAKEVREILGRLKKDRKALSRFDANQDGQIDMQEWEMARQTVVKHVATKHQVSPGRKDIGTLTDPRDRRRPFLLSAVPQFHLTGRYKMYAASCMAAFLITGSTAVYMIAGRLA